MMTISHRGKSVCRHCGNYADTYRALGVTIIVCGNCDRLRCGNCGTIEMTGDRRAAACTGCGEDIAESRRKR